MAERDRSRGRKRRKVCQFCVDKVAYIDYKDTARLRKFMSERITPSVMPRIRLSSAGKSGAEVNFART